VSGGAPLGWVGIVRLGLVQTALGSIVVLTTATLNRVMVVELALPALLPGALVAFYYAIQIVRPRLGHGSDVSGRRTPWIIGGMAVLALGGFLAAAAIAVMEARFGPGLLLAVLAFALIGLGVGAAGTSLLVLLAKRVDSHRRPTAATIVWLMMIAGFIVTTISAGKLLDPFSTMRLVAVSGGVSLAAFLLTIIAVAGIEGATADRGEAAPAAAAEAPFRAVIKEVWAEPIARQFTIFVFVSMLAYSAQDLILEPFAGAVFGLTPGQSTQLSGIQYAGVLSGMLMVGAVAPRVGSLASWMIGGCIGSALALLALATAGFVGPAFPLGPVVFLLGAALGTFAVAAIGSMMGLVDAGAERREGVRMGLFGGAQAIAFGVGGLAATAGVDATRWLLGSPLWAYATVFIAEGLIFLVAAGLAARVGRVAESRKRLRMERAGEGFAAGLGGG